MSYTSRAALTAVAIASCMAATSPVLAKSKASIGRMEDKLAAAGFEAKPADTPQRQAMLTRLPKEKFVQRVHGDAIAYVYADPKNCNCLYVGSQQAYGAYRRQEQAQKIADEQQDAAETYADANWDWGPWGPWGGRWGRFGFARGW